MGALGDVRAVDHLALLLADGESNRNSGVLQCEDEELVSVGGAAAEALVRLGYAANVDGVYERAKREGILPRGCPVLRNSY